MPEETFASESPGLRNSVQKSLYICAGLPIALAVTGSAVALRSGTLGNFETAYDAYATRLKKKRGNRGDEDTTDGTSLNAGILLSLECLQDELSKRKVKTDHFIFDLYTSLCVLESQAWILYLFWGGFGNLTEMQLWMLSIFCEMSLATPRPVRECSREAGIVLHDSQLDFCQRQVEETNKLSGWHTRLLNGYVAVSNEPCAEQSNTFVTDTVLSVVPRPWWSVAVPEDGYVHANLSRHLTCSGLGIELAALLLEGR